MRHTARDDARTLYLAARRAEGRLVTDEALRDLPCVPEGHPHHREWRIRAHSLARFVRHLERRFPPGRHVLDLGCGNGWMSHALARVPRTRVTGVDVNEVEIAQARRVFRREGLSFVVADVFEADLAADVVVLAGSLQYFPDRGALIRRLLDLVPPGGEVHVWDTPIHDDPGPARERSAAYFRSIGVPGMAEHFFHPTWAELEPLGPVVLGAPRSLGARLRRRVLGHPVSPFPWLAFRR